jgi:nucleotide-binding universal stress UspA family protein
VLGSVAEDLVRTLSCPVLTVGPHIEKRFADMARIENILFPTDCSQESLVVFPYLASLAHEYSARLTVLHVLPAAMEGNLETHLLVAPWRKRMMEDTFCPQISPQCHSDFVVAFGDTEETILAYARRTKADLIGLGIRSATEFTKRFSETVAYRILAEAECPVLTHHAVSKW